MKRMLFISGLPRSGSTLLSAILRQNPALHADMSSPLLGVVTALQRTLSRGNPFSVNVDNAVRNRVLRGAFESYYAPQEGRTVFDTNRIWTMKLGLLLDLFPDTRIICCVRSIGAIVESFERMVRENSLEANAIFGFEPEINVYGRVDHLMTGKGVVGVALNSLKDAYFGPHSDRLMLIDYRRLVGDPGGTISALYDFVGEPRYQHDFQNVGFDAHDFDAAAGLPGLHHIRPSVAAIPRNSTLPPDLAGLFRAPEFWTTPTDASRAARVC